MSEKNGVLIYHKYKPMLEKLPRETRGDILMAALEFDMTGTVTTFEDPAAEMFFNFMLSDLQSLKVAWEQRVKVQRENGSKGGRPRKEPIPDHDNPGEPTKPMGCSANPREPEKADNENEKEKDKEREKELPRAHGGNPDPTNPTDHRFPAIDWRDVLSEWHKVPRAPSPGDVWRFTNRYGAELLRLLAGLSGEDYLQAIQNYREMRETPGTWWETNPDIMTWSRKHLDRFLPGNYDVKDFMKDNPGQIDWDKIVAEAEGAKT